MDEEQPIGLRQRTRDAVRDQIAASAIEMFDDQGFENTTVDQIASKIGISPRSFFRYFLAKEDVVVGDPMTYGVIVRDRLREALKTQPPWVALRTAFEFIVEATVADTERVLRINRVIAQTPSLRAKSVEKHLAWADILSPIVAETLVGAGEQASFRGRATTMAALTCLNVATAEWVDRDGAPAFEDVLDATFALLRPAELAS